MKPGNLTSSLRFASTLWLSAALGLFSVVAAAEPGNSTKKIEPIQVDVGPDSVLFATTAPPSKVEHFHVRVAGPKGRLFERTTTGSMIEWRPDHRLKDDTVYNFYASVTEISTQREPKESGTANRGRPMKKPSKADAGTRIRKRMGTLHVESGGLEFAKPSVPGADRGSAKASPGTKAQSYNDQVAIFGSSPNLYLEDTDTSGDSDVWTFVANDEFNSAYIQSIEGTNLAPFRIENTAPENSLFIEDSGQIGIGNNSPTESIHVTQSDSPGIRFDDGSTGVWRIEEFGDRLDVQQMDSVANFTFTPDEEIGIGTLVPSAPVHLWKNDGTARILVTEDSGTTSARELFKLQNNGGPFFIFQNTDLGESYSFAMGATGHFLISHQQTSGVQMRLRPNGDMEIQGTLVEGSSRAEKSNVKPVDEKTVLAKLDRLPISEWNYRGDPAERHVSPMAEDFYSTFGLGPDSEHIAPKDLAGVALSAAKGLKEEVERKDERITELESRNRQLEQRLRAIENRLGMTRR